MFTQSRYRYLKRVLDVLLSSLLILACLPLLLILAAGILLLDGWPILIAQDRIGFKKTTFKCLKLRTMFRDSDRLLAEYLASNAEARIQWERYQKLTGHDPRVTGLGRWLRKFSLDELPQLFNVLRGDMSIVGPRPYLPRELSLMGHYLEDITRVKPGITGLWQISGRNLLPFETRLEMDALYARTCSLALDLRIILATPIALLKGCAQTG